MQPALAEQRLWAPWRRPYIQKSGGGDDCIFCSKPALGDDEKALIAHRGERCFVMLNAFPYNPGHVMVAPFEHTARLQDLDEPTSAELMGLAQRSLRALEDGYTPEGFNIGVNLGKIAGAGVADHVHLHVVPRWAGDTNFMPVVGDTRVISEGLDESYRTVRDALSKLSGGR
jgi:ATP adenylyltransferase